MFYQLEMVNIKVLRTCVMNSYLWEEMGELFPGSF